jgi:hypothetical protein
MFRRLNSTFLFALSAALAAVAAFGDGPSTQPVTDPTTTAVTEPTAPQLKIQLWSVLVIDATNGQANSDGLVHSVLPEFVNDKRFDDASPPPIVDTGVRMNRRWVVINGRMVPAMDDQPAVAGAATPTTAPSPLTVIRLGGWFDGKFDVSLKAPAGATWFGHWPPAEVRTDELLWRDLTVATTSPVAPTTAPAESIFTTLRSGDFPYASITPKGNPTVTEKFLTVDLAFAMSSPLSIKKRPDGSFGVTDTGHGTLHRLTFYRTVKNGLEQAEVGDLALPTTQQSSTQPTTRAVLTTRPTDVAADWTEFAKSSGLDPVDAKLIGPVIASYTDDGDRLTAVYRMDDDDAAKLFPIDVTPTPKSVDRFVLVVIRNADPTAKTAIDALIQKLGDDDWNVREAAYHTLAGYGPAAINKLTGATSDKDAEIAWRAQRLLLMARKQ